MVPAGVEIGANRTLSRSLADEGFFMRGRVEYEIVDLTSAPPQVQSGLG
jgi:hypothetical protein